MEKGKDGGEAKKRNIGPKQLDQRLKHGRRESIGRRVTWTFCTNILSPEADLRPRLSMHTMIRIIGTSGQQYDTWTEPQLNLE
jgi:hypothetical protein